MSPWGHGGIFSLSSGELNELWVLRFGFDRQVEGEKGGRDEVSAEREGKEWGDTFIRQSR
jgi:hypothetical protein